MTTHTSNESIAKKWPARPTATTGVVDPALLTDTELDHVAAAGSKAGGTTDGRGGPLRIPGEAL